MVSSPFISLCITTYKRTDLLEKLLNSIVIQTYTDYELLINDNTPDDTIEKMLDTYSNRLNIDYVRNNPSVSAGMNAVYVMRRAKGEWIKLMHDDDWFDTNDALKQFADAAKKCKNNFVFSAAYHTNLQTGEKELVSFSDKKKQMLNNSPLALFAENIIGQPSITLVKNHTGIEFDAGFNFLLDIDFYMRYLFANPGYCYIDKPLVNIGVSSGQETYRYYKNIKVELPEYFTLLAKFGDDLNISNPYAFLLIWNMLKRYKIKDPQQIYDVGYKGPMPTEVKQIIAFQKYIPHIVLKQPPWSNRISKMCYRKIFGKPEN